MGAKREKILRVENLWQLGLEHGHADVQVFEPKPGQASLGRQRRVERAVAVGIGEVGGAQADKGLYVGAAQAHALEGDVAHARIIGRDAGQALDGAEHGGAGAAQRARDQLVQQGGLGRQTGVHGAGKGFAEIELEVTLEVDKIAQVHLQVGQLEAAQHDHAQAGAEADGQVQVLDEVHRAVQEAQIEPLGNQIRQARQADGWEQARARQRKRQAEREIG